MANFVPWNRIKVPHGYSLSDKGLGYETKDKAYRIVAPPLALIRGNASLETDNQTYTLQYLSPGNIVKTREVEAASLTSRDIEGWVSFGIGITPANKPILLQYLVEQRMLIPIETVYEGVGWIDSDSFGADRLISLDTQKSGYLNNDNFNLQPKGSKQAWFDMWSKISDSIPLQLALSIGLTAPLLRPLSELYPDLETLIFSIVGNSSTGKSSMLSLLLSTSGAVQPMQQGSLFQSWSSTANALSLRLNGNRGVVQGLDELSRFRGRDITDVLYNLASGTEKARATKSVTLRKLASWQTTIVSTGEHGFLDGFAAGNQGLRMRIVEYTGAQPWTRSSTEAELIKKVCANNYGWLLPDFVRNMLLQLKQVKAVFPGIVETTKKMIPESPYRDRIAVKLAVVEVAAELANATWQAMNIDCRAIMQLLISNTTSTWQTGLGERMYENLIDYLKVHQAALMLEDSPGYLQSKMIGTVTMESNPAKMYVNLYPSEYKRIVTEELGAQSDRVVSSELKAKHYLVAERGRNTARIVRNGKRVTVVSLIIPKEEERYFVLRKSWDANGVRNQH